MFNSLIGTTIGVAVGAAVTWVVTYFYYCRAAKDLRRESERLAELTAMIFANMD
jgi:uncharacterized membrane protein (DUF485 family)